MKWPKLIPIVEITTTPQTVYNRKKREASPTPAAAEEARTEDEASSARPQRKRRKTVSTKNEAMIPLSPTLSDLNYQDPDSDHASGVAPSPTVSELALPNDSSTAYESVDEALEPLSNKSERVISRLTPTLASGSNVTLEDLPSSSKRPLRNNTKLSGIPQPGYSRDPVPAFDFSEPDHCEYEVLDDELVESEELAIPGETSPSDIALLNDEIPVRVLRNFAVYQADTKAMVSIAILAEVAFSREQYTASGDVSALANNDGSYDEIESSRPDSPSSDDDSRQAPPNQSFGQRIQLKQILEWNIHDWSPDDSQIDRKIYVRTKCAWYILDTPSVEYRPFFLGFWLKHAIFNTFTMSALKSKRMTYQSFLEDLQESNSNDDQHLSILEVLGRPISRSDVEADETKAYLRSTVPDFCNQNELYHVRDVPLIHEYFGEDTLEDFEDAPASPRKSTKSKKKRPGPGKRILSNKELDILKHRTQTVVTPTVSRIAKNLFKGSLEVAGTSSFDRVDDGVATAIEEVDHTHHVDPKTMQWGPATEDGRWFTSVEMDGTTYSIGDDVMVVPGSDDDAVRVKNDKQDYSKSVNSYANRVWFCKICYFYEKKQHGKRVKMFHGQWFLHGSKTILQETSHSRALYLTYRCDDDLPVASIFKRCHITILGPGDPEPLDDARPDAREFHCSLVYDEKRAEFVDLLSQDEIASLLDTSDPDRPPCISCAVETRTLLQSVPTPLSQTKGIAHYGIEYHQYDFVYIRQAPSVAVFQIAQITAVTTSGAFEIQYYGRWDDFVKEHGLDENGDARCLYQQDRTDEVDPRQLNGICHVLQLSDPEGIETWVYHDDHFYVNSVEIQPGKLAPMKRGTVSYCKRCCEERNRKLVRDEELLKMNGPIVGLELFSGAGGLSTGMDMSKFVTTKYAVEFSPSAAATHEANHPETTVYCQDTSNLLKHAIETEEGKNPAPLKSYSDGQTELPPMPRKGEINFIYGGPPCQSFSNANHTKKADDIRSTLPGNMLSYAEHYDPDYFLLENVTGLLNHPLMSTTDGRTLVGGIKSGVVKFIVRTLIALGYQVRFRLLQAGSYGAPQSRRRVIFIGAKRGIRLPSHPLPMYAFPRGMHRITLPTGHKLEPLSRSLNPDDDPHQCAPLPALTVDDTISDLVPFDWKNPRLIVTKAKYKTKYQNLMQEDNARAASGIKQFNAVLADRSGNGDPVGFPHGTTYATEPTNRYQLWLREGNGDEVHCHYTKGYNPRAVEAVVTVPLEGGKCHRDLPLELQPDHAKPGEKQSCHVFYGRMHGDSQFKCATTTAQPHMKGTWLLHPSQKRIVTVREMARAQGFPDRYIFKSADLNTSKMVENQMRQIGNAVPVPLALALGKCIGASLLEEWEKKAREGSPVV